MQNDSPESDPRLQKTITGPFVATGFVDPCLVYLETTLPGDVSVLYACLALSSSEVKNPGCQSHLKLDDVAILKWRTKRIRSGLRPKKKRLEVKVSLSQKNDLLLLSNGEKFIPKISSGKPLMGNEGESATFQGSIRFIDSTTAEAFQKLWSNSAQWDIFAEKILKQADVAWPSIADALASLKRKPLRAKPVPFRRKLGHLIYSMFKKKPKPVAA
jgi:hypothetical protein